MTESTHPLTGILVVAPSTVAVGEAFSVGVKLLTEPYAVAWNTPWWHRGSEPAGIFNLSYRGTHYLDNVPPAWRGVVRVDGGAACAGPAEAAFPTSDDPKRQRPIRRVGPYRFDAPGVYTLTVVEPESGITARSNVIAVTAEAPAERLFWGDLHAQTFFSDGLRGPEEIYAFARDESFLDIFALSDHAEPLTDRQWDYFTAVTNDFNDPGRFATLLGFEWTNGKQGHRNAYFPGDHGPIWRSTDPAYNTTEKLYAAARAHGALLIPHHSANAQMGVDWSLGYEPEHERLVEIHSIWGNSERPAAAGNPLAIRAHGGEKDGQHVQDALRRGYRFGFTGGGDIHDGRPGDELHRIQPTAGYDLLHRQGIMGVWAPALTREAIFTALWQRRVYATTNRRLILRFTANGHPMGAAFATDGPVRFHVDAHSDTPIARIDLVKDGADWQTLTTGTMSVDWHVEDTPDTGSHYYYVRVTREDGEMAWGSPVWVAV